MRGAVERHLQQAIAADLLAGGRGSGLLVPSGGQRRLGRRGQLRVCLLPRHPEQRHRGRPTMSDSLRSRAFLLDLVPGGANVCLAA